MSLDVYFVSQAFDYIRKIEFRISSWKRILFKLLRETCVENVFFEYGHSFFEGAQFGRFAENLAVVEKRFWGLCWENQSAKRLVGKLTGVSKTSL